MEKEKDKIEKFLRENPQGTSIQELSIEFDLPRQKVAIILAELKGEDKILVREIGQVKLHYFKEEKENAQI